LHIWPEQYNLTRRVIAITYQSDAWLVLAWKALGVLAPIAWSLCASSSSGLRGNYRAKNFANVLKRLLASQFPDETVESATISADLEHPLSGNYLRGLSQRGSHYKAFPGRAG
jgi:hypothetical protein